MIEVIPKVFSPDQDGTDDFTTIQFSNITPGMLATVRVFDVSGRLIIRLAENVSIGDDAVIRWDGIDENGQKARIGPYILWIELFTADGTVERFKRTCVLAERL
jgi:hypothetical protein